MRGFNLVTQEIIRNGTNYRTYRKCKGCGEIDLALCDAKGNFREEYCLACSHERVFQKWDEEFIYYETKSSKKRAYKRTCFICGKVEYLKPNKDGLFNSPYCRSCSNRVRGILRHGCPLGFKSCDNASPLDCLNCKLSACYFDILDIKNGELVPHKLKGIKK